MESTEPKLTSAHEERIMKAIKNGENVSALVEKIRREVLAAARAPIHPVATRVGIGDGAFLHRCMVARCQTNQMYLDRGIDTAFWEACLENSIRDLRAFEESEGVPPATL